MTAALPTGEVVEVPAKRWNLVATALIALAFAMPFIGMATNTNNAATAGERTVYTLLLFAGLMLLALLAARGKSKEAKAKARLTVGALLCVFTMWQMYGSVTEKRQARQFVRDAFTFQAKQGEAIVEFNKRFEAISLETILTPDGIGSATGIAAGRTTLGRYRALLAEKRDLLRRHGNEAEAFVKTLPPGAFRDGAEAGMAKTRKGQAAQYEELDREQTAVAADIETILNWSNVQVQASKLAVKGGQLLFATAAQRAELQQMLNKLQASEQVLDATLRKMQADLEETKRTQRERAAEFLK